jgi:cell division protein FtsB
LKLAVAQERSGSFSRPNTSGAAPRSRQIVRLLLLFALALIAMDGLVGDHGLLAMLRARRQHDQLVAEIAQQRAENVRLAEEARRLATDPSAIEEIARRELGMIRPGEKIFVLKDANPAPQGPPARTAPSPAP